MTLGRPNSGLSLAGSTSNTSKAAPATWPVFSASASARSSTRPPRAQLTMRTPFLVFFSAAASMMLRVLSVSGVCKRDEVGAAQQVVELDLLHAQLHRPLGGQERIEGDHLHLQADGAVGDDRADVAAADDAERLGGELDAHELGLLPFAGLRGAVGLRDLAGQRHHQRERMLGRGDGIAEGRVHDDDALGGGGLDVDVVDADAGAADHLAAWPRRRSPSRSPWWPSARRGRRSRR